MRPLAWLRAKVFGYFWKACPRCGEKFGGHEIRGFPPTTYEQPDGTTRVVCPRCTWLLGLGDDGSEDGGRRVGRHRAE